VIYFVSDDVGGRPVDERVTAQRRDDR